MCARGKEVSATAKLVGTMRRACCHRFVRACAPMCLRLPGHRPAHTHTHACACLRAFARLHAPRQCTPTRTGDARPQDALHSSARGCALFALAQMEAAAAGYSQNLWLMGADHQVCWSLTTDLPRHAMPAVVRRAAHATRHTVSARGLGTAEHSRWIGGSSQGECSHSGVRAGRSALGPVGGACRSQRSVR